MQFSFSYSKRKMTYPEIKPFHYSEANAILLRGNTEMNYAGCNEALKKAAGKNVDLLLTNLL